MSNRVQILSTGFVGSDLVSNALAQDIMIDEIPFIRIEPITNDILKDKISRVLSQSVTAVFTSANSVNQLANYITGPVPWSIYCIGNATQKGAVKIFGHERITGTGMDAKQLAQVIINDKVTSIVFFCGDHRRDELPELLSSQEVQVEEIEVYRTLLTPSAITKKYDGVLFFSPTAVESFFSINNIAAGTSIFAIGKTTADALKQFIKTKVIIADTPGKEEMIRILIEHYKEPTTRVCNN